MADNDKVFQLTGDQRTAMFNNVGIGTPAEREDFLDSAERLIRLYNQADPGPVLDVRTYRKAAKDLQSAVSRLSSLMTRPFHQTLSGLSEEEAVDLLDNLAAIEAVTVDHLYVLKSYRKESPGKPLLQALAKRWQEIFKRRPGHSARSHFATVMENLKHTGGVDLPTVKKRMLQ